MSFRCRTVTSWSRCATASQCRQEESTRRSDGRQGRRRRSSVHNCLGRPQAGGFVVLRVVHDMWSGGHRSVAADLHGCRPCDHWDKNGTGVTTRVEVHPQLCTHLWVNVDDDQFCVPLLPVCRERKRAGREVGAGRVLVRCRLAVPRGRLPRTPQPPCGRHGGCGRRAAAVSGRCAPARWRWPSRRPRTWSAARSASRWPACGAPGWSRCGRRRHRGDVPARSPRRAG